jgi:dipeptidyl aminopeptidase/acylaminoacyl peptidase
MHRVILMMSLFICAVSSQTSHAESLSNAQLFSKSAEYRDVKISPTGKYLSVITTHDGKKTLMVLDLKSKTLLNAINFASNAEVGNYEWANDERIVLQKVYLKGWKDVPQYYGELFAVNADGSAPKYLFGYNLEAQQVGSHIKNNTAIRATAYILDPLPDDDKYMLVNAVPWGNASSLNYDNLQDVYRVHLYSGKRKRVTTAPIGRAQFLTNYDGEVKFVAGVDQNNHTQIFYRHDKEWINSDKLNIKLDEFYPISYADSPDTIFAAGRVDDKTLGVYKIDLNTGEKQKIIQDSDVDPSNYWINKQTKQLYAVEFDSEYPAYDFVDPKDSHAQLLKQLIASLPGHQIQIVSETTDSKTLIVKAFNDRNPGDYYLFDVDNIKLAYLFSQKNWLDPELMAEVKPISFTNRDGQVISGYLTLPHGKEAKDLPLVVNPHGGPHFVRDTWGFDADNQFLASQGIAVLQVNFRGSTGFGEKFEHDGYQKWGSDIQHDIIDGTLHIIGQGIANKDRVCIVGVSFGGYSALQSSILAPDLFKCAVGVAGVYDLEMMFDEGDVADSRSGMSYLKRVLGENKTVLNTMSPSKNVAKLKAKLLLVHGGDDDRAPIEQLESLEDALKSHNYPYEKLVVDSEGHGFYNDEHRAQYYEKMLPFLKKNLNM